LILLGSQLLQVLELLRGLALTPASEADQEAKAAAAAALDAAADEAVAALKQQHATALSNATAAARHQALMGALNARIRFSPGKPPLSAAVAAAVIDTAADELTSALADAGSNADSAAAGSNAAGLAARRLAAERLVGTASVIDSTAAALAAALGEEDEQAGELSVQLQKLSDAAAAVQEGAIKVVDVKFNKQPAKAATEEDDQESTEAAEDKAAAAVAALEEALQAAVAAVAAMPAAGDGSVTKEGVRSEIEKEVEEAAAAAEEKTKGQQGTALQVRAY
jgi:hypothetical protein